MTEIVIDTGVLGIHFSKNPTVKVQNLMKKIQTGKITAIIPKTVLIEAVHKLCKSDGKQNAQIIMINFLKKIPIDLVELDKDLILSAGILKCQHSAKLSYVDCIGIAVALNKNVSFHTTEKNLKKIPHHLLSKLKVETYRFL